MKTANMEVVEKIHALFSRGELAQVLEYAQPDVVVDAAALGAKFTGRDGFMGFMKTFRDAFPDIQIAHRNISGAGDDVTVEFVWSGTHRGALQTPAGAIPPTGRSVSGARVCEVIRLREGKIATLTNYQDVGTWMRQLGLVK